MQTQGPVDEGTVAALASSFGGGEEGWGFVRELIDTFVEDATAQLDAIRRAFDAAEPEEARRAAHTLKSNGATLGAHRFAALCRELEGLSRQGEVERARGLLAQAQSEWWRVRDALQAIGREPCP